jgi:APA family basic amino acid/polyamine antiporter
MEKPTDPQDSPKLERALGLFTGTMLVAGFMIGTGVFKKIVPMAQSGLTAGEILLAWVLAGLVSYLGSTIVVDLSSTTEESGGTYEYLRIAFGNFVAFIFGWTEFTIIGCASIAAMAFILAQTINALIPLPHLLGSLADINIGRTIYPFADAGIKIVAIFFIWVFVWVNCRGVRKAGMLNNLFTVTKIAGILLLIIGGMFAMANNARPVLDETAAPIQGLSFYSVLLGAMLSAFWAYDGWSNLPYVTGEIKNPKRNIPLALFIGIGLVMTLYVLVNYAYMQLMPLPELAAIGKNDIGAAVVAQKIMGPSGKLMMLILLLISVCGALNAIILSHTRVYFRMAQERNFFRKAALVHPVYKTPFYAIIYAGIWSSILVISGTFDMLTDMVIFAGFLFYSLLVAALFKLKRQGKLQKKPFLFPFVQIFMLLFSIALIVNTFYIQPVQSLIGAGLVLSSVPFYYVFKPKAS